MVKGNCFTFAAQDLDLLLVEKMVTFVCITLIRAIWIAEIEFYDFRRNKKMFPKRIPHSQRHSPIVLFIVHRVCRDGRVFFCFKTYWPWWFHHSITGLKVCGNLMKGLCTTGNYRKKGKKESHYSSERRWNVFRVRWPREWRNFGISQDLPRWLSCLQVFTFMYFELTLLSGCVTSAETVLITAQSTQEFLESVKGGEKTVMVSISPQSRASLAVHFGLDLLQVCQSLFPHWLERLTRNLSLCLRKWERITSLTLLSVENSHLWNQVRSLLLVIENNLLTRRCPCWLRRVLVYSFLLLITSQVGFVMPKKLTGNSCCLISVRRNRHSRSWEPSPRNILPNRWA